MAILETGRLIKQNERKCPRHIIHIPQKCSITPNGNWTKDIEHFLVNEYDKNIGVR
jgi:hypothetical protein